MAEIQFYNEHLSYPKKFRAVYKMTINDEWFYIGSSVDIKRRISNWENRILNGMPKNANIKFLLPFIKYIKFEILESVDEYTDPKILEDFYIKKNIDDFNCLNMCPSSFGMLGIRKGFGQSVKWKPKGESPLPRKVAMFNKSGKLLNVFESLRKASYELTGKFNYGSDISSVANGKSKWFMGMIFKFIDHNGVILEPTIFKAKKTIKKKYDIVNKPMVTSRKFYQKSISGEIIKTWNNYQAAAISIGVSRGAIYKYLTKSNHIPHRGYFWEYA